MKKISIPIRIIVLRNRSEIQVSFETGERIKSQLATISQHVFVKISELDRVINTADIVEVKNDVRTDYEEEEPLTPLHPERMKELRKTIDAVTENLKVKGII